MPPMTQTDSVLVTLHDSYPPFHLTPPAFLTRYDLNCCVYNPCRFATQIIALVSLVPAHL